MAGIAVGGLIVGLLGLASFVGACTRSSRALARLEEEVVRLGDHVNDHRAAHEHFVALLVRQLDAVEASVAQAANEVRMASDQLIARLPTDPSTS